MDISNLDEFFDITHYRPDITGRATVEFADGVIRLRLPYRFYSEGGQETPHMMINAVVTPEQLSSIRTMLVTILQATNDEIESQHGWERYEE